MASFAEGQDGAGNWFEQNQPPPSPGGGVSYPGGSATFNESAGPRPQRGDMEPMEHFQQRLQQWQQQQQGTSGGTPTQQGGPITAWNDPLGGRLPKTYQEAQQAFNQLFPGEQLTPQMLQEHEAELNALGFQLRPNAQGVVGKIQWGSEPIVDVIQGAGSGLNRKQWLTGAPVPGGGALGGIGAGYQGGFGGLVAPWTEGFKPRDPNEIMQDPAYQFQLKEGLRGVTSGAAAKGTLLTGGTLKALEGYGQGLASTYNDKYYNRDLGEYGIRRDNFQANQDRPFDKFYKAGQLGKPNP